MASCGAETPHIRYRSLVLRRMILVRKAAEAPQATQSADFRSVNQWTACPRPQSPTPFAMNQVLDYHRHEPPERSQSHTATPRSAHPT